jgi:lipooligosaccharide transport system permease protein
VLVGKVPGPGGHLIPYRDFVAPGLLAVSSMNGAMYDSTFNIFFRLKYAKLYDAILATPMRPAQVALGEIGWALLRGTIYAVAFILVMLALGLVHSAWAVLAVPCAVLIGFAFAAIGMTGTTYMKSWQDFDYVILASMPLFLFSATFYPLGVYPRAIQVIIECTPLYQGVGAAARLDSRRGRPRPAVAGGLPGRARPGWPARSRPPPGQAAPRLTGARGGGVAADRAY